MESAVDETTAGARMLDSYYFLLSSIEYTKIIHKEIQAILLIVRSKALPEDVNELNRRF